MTASIIVKLWLVDVIKHSYYSFLKTLLLTGSWLEDLQIPKMTFCNCVESGTRPRSNRELLKTEKSLPLITPREDALWQMRAGWSRTNARLRLRKIEAKARVPSREILGK